MVNRDDIKRILKSTLKDTFDLDNKQFMLKLSQDSLNIYADDEAVNFNLSSDAITVGSVAKNNKAIVQS